MLFNILLSRLGSYVDKIIGDHQCKFRRNRSTSNQIFFHSSDAGEMNNETVHQLFIDFKKAYDSARREVLYNIHIEFGVLVNLVRLTKICLKETYSKVLIRGIY
jgi:hypothetical protein